MAKRRAPFPVSSSSAGGSSSSSAAVAGASVATVCKCVVCHWSFDEDERAPRRTPCCRRLLCGSCAALAVKSRAACHFCDVVPSPSVNLSMFNTDVGVVETLVAACAPPLVKQQYVPDKLC